jgi:hypothetical protein
MAGDRRRGRRRRMGEGLARTRVATTRYTVEPGALQGFLSRASCIGFSQVLALDQDGTPTSGRTMCGSTGIAFE